MANERVKIPPAVPCPTCGAHLTVTDDLCARCGRTFAGGVLWTLYETRSRDFRAPDEW